MQGNTETELTRVEIKAVLDRHYGSRKQLADELSLSKTAITLYLKGKMTSQGIEHAAREFALRLLQEERRQKLSGSVREFKELLNTEGD